MSNIAESAKTIYLDYAATTPIDPSVLRKMLPYFSGDYSNPSSMHSSGRRAKQAISHARQVIADILCALPEEIIFTGSGTESDNLALIGIARAHKNDGDHIIISSIEHKAVTESAQLLEKEGFKVSIAPVDHFGLIDIKACMKLVTEKTILISVMYANNEIGTIEPIKELGTEIRKWKAERGDRVLPFFHTDACQAAGALSLNTQELGVDLMTINSSKIYGPKGVGVLFKKRHIRIQPIIVGGEQERSLRAGTESLPLIVGCSEALILANSLKEVETERLLPLRYYFIQGLLSKIPGAILNGHPQLRLPNNVHISIPHIEGESILLMLDKLGIEASTGSACSAYDLKPSHVLMAIGQTAEFAHGSIRFSFGRDTTKRELDNVLKVFPPVARRLCTISALTVTTKTT
jgi:cysteine desulfurase